MSRIEITEQQRQAWNRVSGGWETHAQKLEEFHRPVSQRLIEILRLQNEGVFVDFGCGNGDLGQKIAQQNTAVQVIGLDLSDQMVITANKTARAKGLTNYTAQVFNIDTSPSLPIQRVKGIVSQYTLMFLADLIDASAKMAESIESGGQFAAAVWGPAAKCPWMTTAMGPISQFLELPKPLPDQPHIFRFAQQGSLSPLLKAVGFVDVNETLVEGTVTFDGPESYFNFISQVAPPLLVLDRVTEDIRHQAKQAVFNAAANYIKNDQLSFEWSSWIVSGTKP